MHDYKPIGIDDETFAILKLSFCRGIGNFAVHGLMREFGTACEVFRRRRDRLQEVDGISTALAESITRGPLKEEIENELDLIERCNTTLIAIGDDRYPGMLRHLGDAAPPLLRVRGEYRNRDQLAVALVGSRNCTHYGRVQARRFSLGLIEKGFTIVSGHARGIDSECHRAALQAGGRTVAVLGCGIAQIDKLSDPELALQIAGKGALISELPMCAPPLARNFPPRNRLISGLSTGVVVVEAGRRSGTLITARFAGEQGKAVFAIPGNVESSSSRGCHELIRDGAILTENPRQVVDELGPLPHAIEISEGGIDHKNDGKEVIDDPRQMSLNGREKQILNFVEHEPRLLDDLIEAADLPVSVISSTLMSLEIRGLVTRLEGNRYVRGSA